MTLTSAEAQQVHEAMLLAGAYLSAEIEGEKVAGQPPPLEGIGSLRALAAEIEASQTSGAANIITIGQLRNAVPLPALELRHPLG